MKTMKKFLSIIVVCIFAFSLSSCGGGGSSGGQAESESPYAGKYIAVAGEALGVTLTGDEVDGFSLNLESNGKGTMTVNDDSGKCTWTADDTTLTIKVEGEEIVGTLGQDTITFDDMLNMGMKLIFAKEGTDAANPENYLPEKEKNMLGVWKSNKVTDVLKHDASEEIDPAAITIEFFSDHTAKATLGEKDLGQGTWSFIGDSGYFDGDYVLQRWSNEGENIELTYSDDDDYWIFTCTKQ